MGQYKNLGQRRAGGAWQWLLIGFFPGLLCGGLILFTFIAFGDFAGFGSEPEVIEVTGQPITIVEVITATPDPAATEAVQIVTATSAPTEEVGEGSIVQPSLTPFGVPVSTEVQVGTGSETEESDATSAEPTSDGDAATQQENTTAVNAQAQSNIPEQLAAVASPLVQVEGGVFQYGTDQIEVLTAANECQNRDGGTCQPSDGQDSTPQVAVQLDTFWIEQDEVTFNQYVAFLNYQNSLGQRHTTACGTFICIQTQNERPEAAVIAFDGATYFIPTTYETLRNHPAYGVTWYGAQAYCEALGRRLPTEAEWEYAARGGDTGFIYPWGNNWSPEFANVRLPLVEGTGNATVAVNAIPLGDNNLGLTHMAGNVAEWVNDYYSEGYYQQLSQQQQASGEPVSNPTGPAGGTQRVLRGGSFNALPFFARTVHRQAEFPAPEDNNGTYPLWVGFRCASSTGPNTSTGVQSGNVDPSSLAPTVPVTGDNASNNAQPTAEIPPETSTEEGSEGSRG